MILRIPTSNLVLQVTEMFEFSYETPSVEKECYPRKKGEQSTENAHHSRLDSFREREPCRKSQESQDRKGNEDDMKSFEGHAQ